MFDEKTVKEYLTMEGMACPYCGEDNISADYMQVDGSQAWRRVDCLNPDCLKKWTEVYKLVDIE